MLFFVLKYLADLRPGIRCKEDCTQRISLSTANTRLPSRISGDEMEGMFGRCKEIFGLRDDRERGDASEKSGNRRLIHVIPAIRKVNRAS